MLKVTLILCSLLIITSCVSERKNLFSFEAANSTSTDDITSQKINQLGIGNLKNGFDSLQIRIWYDYSLLKNRDLVIIQLKKGKWLGFHYSMVVDWDPLKNTETIVTKTVKNVTPKSGWNDFLIRLSDLRITSLPNMKDIPGLKDFWDDGNYYNIEIAKGKNYRFYTYHVPSKFEDKFWQARNMSDILRLISTEFNIPN